MGSQAVATIQIQSFHLYLLPGARLLMVSIKSTKQGKQFLDCFTRPPAWPKQIVSMLSIWLRSCLSSFERPRIGSPSSRLRWACIRTRPTARSSGYTECTPRLRIGFTPGRRPSWGASTQAGAQRALSSFKPRTLIEIGP